MSQLIVEVFPLTAVEHHPNADRLDLAVVGGYRVIIGRDTLRPGDLVAYIPDGSILPDALIDELGARAYLAGKEHNRVRATKLRGILSEGLVMTARPEWTAGQNVAEELGITKWEPEPSFGGGSSIAGDVVAAPYWWQSYDLEALKRYPELLNEGETVWVTEKIHGTQGVFGAGPVEELEDGSTFRSLYASSKGLSARRQTLKHSNDNLYWQALLRSPALITALHNLAPAHCSVQIFAEVYGAMPSGKAIQDLTYDASQGLRIAVFDIAIQGEFLPYDMVQHACLKLGLPMVPILYRGPYSLTETLALANGKETISGTGAHIREGVVVRPEEERWDRRTGRVVLKVVSEAYLTRKDGTEYN